MRARRCGEQSKRGSVCGQHYFLDADARLQDAREYGPNNQGGDDAAVTQRLARAVMAFLWSLIRNAGLFERGTSQRNTRRSAISCDPRTPVFNKTAA